MFDADIFGGLKTVDKICEQLVRHMVDGYDDIFQRAFDKHVPDMPGDLRENFRKEFLAQLKESLAGTIEELYNIGGSVESVKENLEALGELNSVVLGDVAEEQGVQDICDYDVSWNFGHAVLSGIAMRLDTFAPEQCTDVGTGAVKPMQL